jgi:hypothetical protein
MLGSKLRIEQISIDRILSYVRPQETWLYLAGALQLSSNELDALVLYVCIRLVRQVSSSNTQAMGCVADAVTL